MPRSPAASKRPSASPAPAPAAAPPAKSGPQQGLARMGLVRDIDLALHLPLRYEDETRIVPGRGPVLRGGAARTVQL